MSEEEKKAIEYLKNRLDILHNNTQWATEKSIKVVLNLIEKQQKEIKELKEKEKNLLKQLKDSEKELLEVTQNVISKDKINDKIKEYQNKLFQDVEENKVVEYENIIQVLEELLGEKDERKGIL